MRSLPPGEGRNLGLATDGILHERGPPDEGGAFAAELGAVSAYYAARMAAVRASARRGDVAALLRALADEQILARREVMSRWQAAQHSAAVARVQPVRVAELHRVTFGA